MITSKPRHDQPIADIRDGRVNPSRQFQRWIDDVTDMINDQNKQIADLKQRIEALEDVVSP